MTKILVNLIVWALVSLSLICFRPAESITYGPSYPEKVMAAHNCWTGGTHAFPTHAVIYQGVLARYVGKTETDYALAHNNAGVVGYCP
jgi:hypothetical protein